MLGDVLLKKIRVAILVAASIAATATAFLIADALNPELTESNPRGVSDSEKGIGEGLKVVGNWTLTTSDPDGSNASTYEFKNELRSSGINLLAWLLTPQSKDVWGYGLDRWSLEIWVNPDSDELVLGCKINEASVAPHKTEVADKWGDMDWNSGIDVAGSCLLGPGSNEIYSVTATTWWAGNYGKLPPYGNFSQKDFATGIPVSEGQLVTVQIEYRIPEA